MGRIGYYVRVKNDGEINEDGRGIKCTREQETKGEPGKEWNRFKRFLTVVKEGLSE